MQEFMVKRPEVFWLGAILLLVSLVLHLMWLSYPREVVFDEVHFGKFVTSYCCTGERFFDIHPPHAKLMIAGVASLAGYRGGLAFDHIGQPYGVVSPIGFRLVPALAGSLIPLFAFILLLNLGASRAAAFFGGAILLFDNALLAQTRLLLLDGVLLASILGSLIAWFVAVRGRGAWQRWLFVVAGGLAGLAAGTKFTGLVALGLLGVLVAVQLWRCRHRTDVRRWLTRALLVLLGAAVVYVSGWIVHFLLLDQPGPGDAWRVAQWERPLVLSFFRETIELHKIMLSANSGLEAGHPDASSWWEWPLMRTSVFYWQNSVGGRSGLLYLLGNPLVWWGSGVLVLFMLLDVVRRGLFFPAAFGRAGVAHLWVLLLGYFAALAPLILVSRALFLYHYLSPLVFAVLAGVLWLDDGSVFKRGSVFQQSPYYAVSLFVLLAFFIAFSPLTYGFIVSTEIHDWLFWLPTWR